MVNKYVHAYAKRHIFFRLLFGDKENICKFACYETYWNCSDITVYFLAFC